MNKKVILSFIVSLSALGGHIINARVPEVKNKDNSSEGKENHISSLNNSSNSIEPIIGEAQNYTRPIKDKFDKLTKKEVSGKISELTNHNPHAKEDLLESSLGTPSNSFTEIMRSALRDIMSNHKLLPLKNGGFKLIYTVNNVSTGKTVELTSTVHNGDIVEGLRLLINQGISLLNENNKISLLNSSTVISMSDDTKKLISEWKNAKIYDSKIDDIIKSFLDQQYEVVWLFYQGAVEGLNEVMNNLVVDKSKSNEVNFKYTANFEKNGDKKEKCFEYKCYVSSLRDDVKKMLYSMLDKAVNILMDGNIIVLKSLNRSVYMPDEGKKLIDDWKRVQVYEFKINEIVEQYIDHVLAKVNFKKEISK